MHKCFPAVAALLTSLLAGVLLAMAVCAQAQAPPLLAVWGSDGSGPGQFHHPLGIAVGPDGNLYVADSGNNRIQVLTSSGDFVTQWGSDGHDPWSLNAPIHVAVDASGRVFVTEFWLSSNSQSGLQVFSSTGDYFASWRPFGDTTGTFAFGSPFGVAVGPDGRVYVADGNSRIYIFTSTGAYVAFWSVGGRGLAVDPSGFVYVMDTGCGCVRKFNASGTQMTSWSSGALDLAVDALGNVYTADMAKNRVVAYDTNGGPLAIWGAYGNAPGEFYAPSGISLGPDGRIYVADTYNNRIQVFGSLPTPTKSSSWGRLKARYR